MGKKIVLRRYCGTEEVLTFHPKLGFVDFGDTVVCIDHSKLYELVKFGQAV